jgi:hypothetical protein
MQSNFEVILEMQECAWTAIMVDKQIWNHACNSQNTLSVPAKYWMVLCSHLKQQLWWMHESQLLITVNYATKLSTVILNICTWLTDSASASADADNGFTQ